jgi:hypothetical protein
VLHGAEFQFKDLQPRNHLYLTTGAGQLTANFPLQTALLPDGYHELTAVAYEGSHVATQSRVSVPVRVQNTALAATLTLVNLGPTNLRFRLVSSPGDGQHKRGQPHHVVYSTGGVVGCVTQSSERHVFPGRDRNCGAGRHPFYAEVETGNGRFTVSHGNPNLVRLQTP